MTTETIFQNGNIADRVVGVPATCTTGGSWTDASPRVILRGA